MVSQSAYVSFPFTAIEAVKMGRYAAKNCSKAENMDKVLHAMDAAGALEFSERHVNELSGG